MKFEQILLESAANSLPIYKLFVQTNNKENEIIEYLKELFINFKDEIDMKNIFIKIGNIHPEFGTHIIIEYIRNDIRNKDNIVGGVSTNITYGTIKLIKKDSKYRIKHISKLLENGLSENENADCKNNLIANYNDYDLMYFGSNE